MSEVSNQNSLRNFFTPKAGWKRHRDTNVALTAGLLLNPLLNVWNTTPITSPPHGIV
jgi:hypothetical protein